MCLLKCDGFDSLVFITVINIIISIYNWHMFDNNIIMYTYVTVVDYFKC